MAYWHEQDDEPDPDEVEPPMVDSLNARVIYAVLFVIGVVVICSVVAGVVKDVQ